MCVWNIKTEILERPADFKFTIFSPKLKILTRYMVFGTLFIFRESFERLREKYIWIQKKFVNFYLSSSQFHRGEVCFEAGKIF